MKGWGQVNLDLLCCPFEMKEEAPKPSRQQFPMTSMEIHRAGDLYSWSLPGNYELCNVLSKKKRLNLTILRIELEIFVGYRPLSEYSFFHLHEYRRAMSSDAGQQLHRDL